MAQIRLVVRNKNTKKVIYKGIKASGEYGELYTKLTGVLHKLINEPVYGRYIYGYHRYHNFGRFPKLLKAYGTPYIWYSEGALDYTYSLLGKENKLWYN